MVLKQLNSEMCKFRMSAGVRSWAKADQVSQYQASLHCQHVTLQFNTKTQDIICPG